MILVDAGPLVALLNINDTFHRPCREAAEQLSPPMVTTWPTLTEAMHILRRRAGIAGQRALWRLLESGSIELATLTPELVKRASLLMEKYVDLPMDLADATLVAVAEDRNLNRIFTLDSDFAVYRLHGRRAFEIVPS